MYTLEQVIDNRLYIHCPEEWQKKLWRNMLYMS